MECNRKFVIILISILLNSIALPFTGYTSLDEAQGLVAKMVTTYAEKNYNFGNNFQQGILQQGKSKVMTIQLYKGNTYVFITGASNAASDIRFRVFNERFKLIKDDNNEKNFSNFEFEAPQSGAYIVKITMSKCDAKGAHWSYTSGYK